MYWYLVKIVYQITCGEGKHTPQFDEQLKLISVNHCDELLAKADAVGRSGEDVFFNHQQQMVRWQYICVTEVFSMHEMMDGMELYSSINEVDNAEAYLRLVNTKAAALQQHVRSGHMVTLI